MFTDSAGLPAAVLMGGTLAADVARGRLGCMDAPTAFRESNAGRETQALCRSDIGLQRSQGGWVCLKNKLGNWQIEVEHFKWSFDSFVKVSDALLELFNKPNFAVKGLPFPLAVELFAVLKSIIAVAAGYAAMPCQA